VIGVRHALAAAVADEPLSSGVLSCAPQKKTQQVFNLLSDDAPVHEAFSAYDQVQVRRIGARGVEAPTAIAAQVNRPENQHLLDVPSGELCFGMFRPFIILPRHFRIGWLISLAATRVTARVGGAPGAVGV
jgi:hypothetical protein